jgi:hypothetical protein
MLRRLPINNIDADAAVRIKVSITTGLTVNAAIAGADAATLVVTWPIADVTDVERATIFKA